MQTVCGPVLKGLLVLALLAGAPRAQACDGPFPSIADYTSGNVADPAIFFGTVVATTPFWERWAGAHATSTIRVSKWYLGRMQSAYIKVQHGVAPAPTIPCGGIKSLFSGRRGQQWLVVGRFAGAEVEPETMLTYLVENGDIPAEVLRQLEVKR